MSGFEYGNINGVGYYTINDLEETGMVKTCVSSRIGGVSEGGFGSLNLGFKTEDNRHNVERNLDILCSAAGFCKEDMVFSDQVHGDRCRAVKESDRGKGTVIKSDIEGIDALITNEKGLALCIFTADCVPVFLLDTKNEAIGMCHAGWRGVINRIVPKTIEQMKINYGTAGCDIIAAVGPSIGPCCFEVGDDAASKFHDSFGGNSDIIINNGSIIKVNLWSALKLQLEALNVRRCVISELCTCCGSDKFYSYRRDGAETGRMISIMQMV